MKSPCLECLVRTSCCVTCTPWYDWLATIFPLDYKITLDEFLEKGSTVGPLQNYWINNFNNIEDFTLHYRDKQYEMTITTKNWRKFNYGRSK